MKESLFFKRQIAEKGLELLGMLGVDQYIDIDEIEEKSKGQQCDEDYDWQNIDYQLHYPHKQIPKTMEHQIMSEYKQFKCVQVTLGKKIAYQISGDISFHWLIRQEEALVDFFTLTIVEMEGRKELLQLFEFAKHSNMLIELIGQANKRWQYEGVYISGAFPQKQHYNLVVRLKQSLFTCTIRQSINSAQEIMLIIKASIIQRTLNNQVTSYLGVCQPLEIKKKLQTCYIRQLIKLVYRLHSGLGVTLAIKNNRIEDKLLARSNQARYHRSIYYIAQLCTNESIYEKDILRIAQCQQEEVDTAFKNLYLNCLPQDDEDDIQCL